MIKRRRRHRQKIEGEAASLEHLEKQQSRIISNVTVASLVFSFSGIATLDSTVVAMRLFCMAFLPGMLFGLWMVPRFKCASLPVSPVSPLLPQTSSFKSWLKRSFSFFPVTISLLLGVDSAALASMINRRWASPQAQFETHRVLEKKASRGKHTNYSFVFEDNHQPNGYEKSHEVVEEVNVDFPLYKMVAIGDTVRLTTRRGFFGFVLIEKVEKMPDKG